MKILINFLIILFTLSLQSCYVTKSVILKENSYLENFDKLLIDQEHKKIILISSDEKYHYIIPDEDGTMAKLALWDSLSEIRFSTKYGSALLKNDTDFEVPYFILVTNKVVTSEKQIAFPESLGFNEVGGSKLERGRFTKSYIAKSGKKVRAKKIDEENIQTVNFDSPYQMEFLVTTESTAQKASKLILLPFAAAADVVLLPITIPVWLVTRDEDNKTP